ncbi:MAG: hypothetical protein AAF822_03335 [Pseudomonadota bacterium]
MIPPRLHIMPESLDVLRGAKAIAGFLNTSPGRVYRLHRQRLIPLYTEGATLCGRKTTLMAWIERQEGA